MRCYARRWKIAGSSPDKVIEFFSVYPILPATLGPGFHSASVRNEHQKQKNNISGEWSEAGA
jgi:hypothetical protein